MNQEKKKDSKSEINSSKIHTPQSTILAVDDEPFVLESVALMTVRYMSKEIIQRLATAAEFKDAETGAHILRMSLYTQKVAQAMGMPVEFVETITFASPMHDVGKIGIADCVILKAGCLTAQEFEIMKTHTTIGEKILSGSSHYNIQVSASIALNHHERWDGTGYPGGLKGEEIPIE